VAKSRNNDSKPEKLQDSNMGQFAGFCPILAWL